MVYISNILYTQVVLMSYKYTSKGVGHDMFGVVVFVENKNTHSLVISKPKIITI